MSFSDTLVWFREPGFAVFFFGSLVLAYHVSARAHLFVQIGICVFCGSFISSHWAKDEYLNMALYWMYAGWAGFLFHKLGGMVLLKGVRRVIRNRFESMGREPVPSQSDPQARPQPQTSPPRGNRRESYSQQEEAFRERARRREQDQASTRRKAEPETKQRQSQTKSESPPKPDPAPEPEPKPKPKREEKKAPPQPEPKRERKQFWWEVLDTPESSDLPTIKKAYRTMIQKYHPDRVSHLGEEFQVIAEDKTKKINGAFEEAKKRWT